MFNNFLKNSVLLAIEIKGSINLLQCLGKGNSLKACECANTIPWLNLQVQWALRS